MAVFTIVQCLFSSILFQFLVLIIQSRQDREPLSALALVYLFPAGPAPCSF